MAFQSSQVPLFRFGCVYIAVSDVNAPESGIGGPGGVMSRGVEIARTGVTTVGAAAPRPNPRLLSVPRAHSTTRGNPESRFERMSV